MRLISGSTVLIGNTVGMTSIKPLEGCLSTKVYLGNRLLEISELYDKNLLSISIYRIRRR